MKKSFNKLVAIIMTMTLSAFTFVGCSDLTDKPDKKGTSVVSKVEESSGEESLKEVKSYGNDTDTNSKETVESKKERSEEDEESEDIIITTNPIEESSIPKIEDATRFGTIINRCTIHEIDNKISCEIADGYSIAILSINTDDLTYNFLCHNMILVINQNDVNLYPEDFVPDLSDNTKWDIAYTPLY